MGRVIFELSGFFFLPFIAYAAFLMWQHRHPRAAKHILKAKALQVQTLLGLVFVVGALLFIGLSEDKHTGAYSPAVVKDGKLIPGRVE